ncbi:MAG TPA: dihydrolipoamide acetyltransferase family protein [candidate division Zixibacteria bacterium]|nr:dihydrolipoamide acetyltransferase family protein [candidate division Zixibacteria bacterium]
MPTDVIMPALGVAQEKGTLIRWLKAQGQTVTKGEPLMEIETDKATVEIEAPASGILASVTASPGDEVPVGSKIAAIVAPGESVAETGSPPPPRPPLKEEGRALSGPPSPEPAVPAGRAGAKTLASPAARRIARERGIDLAEIRGSGPGGAVVARDLERWEKAAQPTAPIRRAVPLTPMRRIIAERMAQSKRTAPHFYLTMDVDMTEIVRQRTLARRAGAPGGPSINDYVLAACARALREFPALNASFTERGVEIFSCVNIGLAVALEDGLVVPVIRDADRLSLQDLSKQSRELAEKAQSKKLLPADCEGGTFTVSNLGMFGVDSFTAIINPPQCAILATGRVARRPVADGEAVVVRDVMTMSLSADHRAVDGATAAKFLGCVKRLLEDGLKEVSAFPTGSDHEEEVNR